MRGIPFRSEPGSFSGPGRPWRSNNDCGSGRGHGGSRAHPLLPAPPVHSWAEQGRSQWGGAEVGGARVGSGPGVAGARLAAQGARWEQWAGVDTPRGASRAGASGGGGGPSEGARRRGEDPGGCDAPSASASGRSRGSCTTAPRAGSVHMTGPQKTRTAPPRAAAYADLGGRDPPAGGPRSDRGGSRVGVRDVGPQGGLGRSRQDLVQFLCTVGGHRLSHQDPEPPVALAASPPTEPRPRPAPTVLGEGPGTRGPHPGNTG